MPYCQLYYHIVWSTKDREPLLADGVEEMVNGLLRAKAVNLGAHVYALNGMPDHVHMIVSIPPRIAVSRFIGQVKATASTRFNKSAEHDFQLLWQREYSIFTFDRKSLSRHVAYVEGQKAHHADRTTIPLLERAP